MTRRIELSVNDAPIEMDYFVQSFIDHTAGGIVEALEHTGQIRNLEIAIRGEDLHMILNDEPVPMNSFVTDLIRNTLVGMISSLKGVDEIVTARISISR